MRGGRDVIHRIDSTDDISEDQQLTVNVAGHRSKVLGIQAID